MEMIQSVCLNFQDIYPDSDPCTRTIYNFRNEALYYHDTDIARAVVDLNRKDDDRPPINPDGVIKSHTIMGEKVYLNSPDRFVIEGLLERYYYPYHKKISENTMDPDLLCGFDCHSMLEFPPGFPPSLDNERPFICLSNNGDDKGESFGEDTTCSPELINLLADILRTIFPDEADNIILNTPFKGGHISRFHNDKTPWLQIELNRRAYLQPQWFDPITMQVAKGRLEFLRHKFLQAFIVFCEEVGSMQYSRNYSEPYHRNISRYLQIY